jgi:hypothetical protein
LGLDDEQAFVVSYEQRFDRSGFWVEERRGEQVLMAAIAYPGAGGQLQPHVPARRHLTLVPPPVRSRRRMYWRRRLLVLVALLFVVVAARAALGALGGGPLAAPETPAARGGAAVYVVQSGDTYWSIARHLQPSGDVRALVDQLSSEHGGATLQPGEQLALR